MAHATSVLLDVSPPSHPTKRATHPASPKRQPDGAGRRWPGTCGAIPAGVLCSTGPMGRLSRIATRYAAGSRARRAQAGAGRAASRLFRLGRSARPARRTEGAPTHTRHASGVTGRLSRIAPRYAAGSRAKRAQAGAGPPPGSVSRQRCARGGRLLRRSDPGALLKHPTPCRAPRASPFATQRRVARRACPRPHRRSSPWRPKPGNPDCP